jgi:hypothetical protein
MFSTVPDPDEVVSIGVGPDVASAAPSWADIGSFVNDLNVQGPQLSSASDAIIKKMADLPQAPEAGLSRCIFRSIVIPPFSTQLSSGYPETPISQS